MITIFKNRNTPNEPVAVATLQEVIEAIRGESPRGSFFGINLEVHKLNVENARKSKTSGNKAEYDAIKNNLPGVVLSGDFKARNGRGLNEGGYSGLIPMDVDDLGEDGAREAREKMREDKHAIAAFTSAGGDGVRIVFRVETDDKRHGDAWQAGADYLQVTYCLTADPSGKDLSRLCYLPYDPNAFHNPDAIPLPVPDAPEQPALSVQTEPGHAPQPTPGRSYTVNDSTPAPVHEQRDGDAPEILPGDARDMLTAIAGRGRPAYSDWLKIIHSTRATVGDDSALAMLQSALPEETPGEYADKFAHPYERIGSGTLVHLAKEAGFDWKARLSQRRREDLRREASQMKIGKAGSATPAQQTVKKQMRELPAPICATKMLARDYPVPPVLIEGMLYQRTKMSMTSGSKCFKTYQQINLAVSVATGTEWMGFKTTKARVLYVDLELPDVFFKQRLDAVLEARELTLEDGMLTVWNLRGHCVDMAGMSERIIAVADKGLGLIILDPIYKTLGDADENNNGDINKLMNSIEEVSEQTGAAVVFSHHYAKGVAAGKKSIDRQSGAGVWGRDPDVILSITEHEEKDCFTFEADVRLFKKPHPFGARWEYPLMRRLGSDFDTSAIAGRKETKAKMTDEEVSNILLAIASKGMIRKGSFLEAAKKRMSLATATAALAECNPSGNRIWCGCV